MLVDYINNRSIYIGLSISSVLDIMAKMDFSSKSDGKYEVDGDKVFYILSTMNAKPVSEGIWESHIKYIDIQYIISGKEVIGYTNVNHLTVDKPYNKEKDITFYQGNLSNYVELETGMFMLLYPQDAHMPMISINHVGKPIRKVIFKIAV